MTHRSNCALCVIFSSLALLFIVVTTATVQYATTGAIRGTVLDPLGGCVPQATIVLADSATGARHSATSDAEGRFGFDILPPMAAMFSASQRLRTGFILRQPQPGQPPSFLIPAFSQDIQAIICVPDQAVDVFYSLDGSGKRKRGHLLPLDGNVAGHKLKIAKPYKKSVKFEVNTSIAKTERSDRR